MTETIPAQPKWHCTPAAGKQINTCAITPDGSRVVCGTWVERGDDVKAVYHLYCYDASGALLWSVPVSEDPIEHGVYWVAISDDGATVAAGGEVAYGKGFLTVLRYTPGPPNTMRLRPLLSIDTPGRVNQVSLSGDGSRLLACYNSSIALYALAPGGEFTPVDSFDVGAKADVQSVMIDKAGERAVLASRTYLENNATVGKLVSFEITAQGFSSHQETSFDSGVMRVAITDDGSAWGASMHDGSCVCFHADDAATPAWRYHPRLNVELAYGFGISRSSSGSVHLALGANLGPTGVPGPGFHPGGVVVTLTSDKTSGGYAPQLNWVVPTAFGVNPGVSLDASGCYVTATDGKPDGGDGVKESAGHFYLLDNSNGGIVWSYPTKTMNWPMAISTNGCAIVGGSDDGGLFYWAAD